VFVAAVLYFTLVYHLTKLYGTKYHGVEYFLLVNGGVYSLVFWVGWVLIGNLIPLGIVYHPVLGRSRTWIASACGLVILGGLATMYVVIIGSQAHPMEVFPGMTVLEGGFGREASAYAPSIPEFLLGLGGVAVALLITAVGVRVLQFLPESLADDVVDPHAKAG